MLTLAELYQVETKRLNEQVKRNVNRFPEDFMFQLTDKDWQRWAEGTPLFAGIYAIYEPVDLKGLMVVFEIKSER
jgi:hypothetical protein